MTIGNIDINDEFLELFSFKEKLDEKEIKDFSDKIVNVFNDKILVEKSEYGIVLKSHGSPILNELMEKYEDADGLRLCTESTFRDFNLNDSKFDIVAFKIKRTYNKILLTSKNGMKVAHEYMETYVHQSKKRKELEAAVEVNTKKVEMLNLHKRKLIACFPEFEKSIITFTQPNSHSYKIDITSNQEAVQLQKKIQQIAGIASCIVERGGSHITILFEENMLLLEAYLYSNAL